METILTSEDDTAPMVRALREFEPALPLALKALQRHRTRDASALLLIAAPVAYALLNPDSPIGRGVREHPSPATLPGFTLCVVDVTTLHARFDAAALTEWIDELGAYVAKVQPAVTVAFLGREGQGYGRLDALVVTEGGAA